MHYIKGWFSLDVLSILPFDTIGVVLNSEAFNNLKIVRVIRLLRLLKLLRLARTMTMIERWQNEYSIDFGLLKLCTMFLTVVTMAHWAACGLRLVPELEQDPDHLNWMSSKTVPEEWCTVANNWTLHPLRCTGELETTVDKASLSVQYMAAVYWSSFTLTTLGYGDIVLDSDAEKLFATILMIMGGGVYAYIVGSIFGIMASFGELNANFEQNLDLLNKFMDMHRLPHDVMVELREYFRYSKSLAQMQCYQQLLTMMSPKLKAKTTVVVYGAPVRKFLKGIMPPARKPSMDDAQGGVITEVNTNGTFNIQLLAAGNGFTSDTVDDVTRDLLVLADVTKGKHALSEELRQQGLDREGNNLFVVGAAVLVMSAYHPATVTAINPNGTLFLTFNSDEMRNRYVPRYHVRDLGAKAVQLGQSVDAKSEIPITEFANFTSAVARAIKPQTYTPREVIVAADSKAEGMYLVHKGIVASKGSLYTHGEFFCKEGIVFQVRS
jgi:hypothetical protein